jgi:hypothetical protein
VADVLLRVRGLMSFIAFVIVCACDVTPDVCDLTRVQAFRLARAVYSKSLLTATHRFIVSCSAVRDVRLCAVWVCVA